ncbi:MAG: dihydrofolate reductase family protein [Thermoplasmatota archaeon]
MRRIVTFNNVSADGYFADAHGELGWTNPDPKLSAYVMSGQNIDTALFGRVTYEHFEAFWPAASADPDLPKELRVFADSLDAMRKIVYSRTRKSVTWKNSELAPKFVAKDVERLKAARGGDIIVFGSGTIVRELTAHGLVDEYVFIVNPVLLGSGQSFLRESEKATRVKLLEAKTFASGNVLMRYGRASPRAKRK